MNIEIISEQQPLQDNIQVALKSFIESVPESNYFQSLAFYHLTLGAPGFQPVLIIAQKNNEIVGSLLGVIQSNGSGIKSWMSRRLIVWGGPLTSESLDNQEVCSKLLEALKSYGNGKAIYIEFRNMADPSNHQAIFEENGFIYRDHLNYLVRTDELAAVKKRVSKSRFRQIKTSLKNGASIVEAATEQEVIAFYAILEDLYKTKVKKPIPSQDLFLEFWKSKDTKFFLVKKEDEVIGGIVCPIHKNTIYEWYVCGKDGEHKGIFPSVLATWAPIEWAIENGLEYFDFMGAGSPEADYGVRTFKERFGGEQVCYGRYQYVLNRPLFEFGKVGLKIYQKIA